MQRLADHADGIALAASVYRLLPTRRAADLFQSHQADVVVEASVRATRELERRLGPAASVLEAGCWTGAFSAWLAERNPGWHVVGVDAARSLVRLARARPTSGNVTFRSWDYAAPASRSLATVDAVVSVLGIDFRWGEEAHRLRGTTERGAPAYWRTVTEVRAILGNWRNVTRDGGALVAVLRVTNFVRFLAIVDAALDAGWRFDGQRSGRFRVGRDRLAHLVFVAEGPPRPWHSADLSTWCPGRAFSARLAATADEAAMLAWFVGTRRPGVPMRATAEGALAAWHALGAPVAELSVESVDAYGVPVHVGAGRSGRRDWVMLRARDGMHRFASTRAQASPGRLSPLDRHRGRGMRV